MLKKIIIIITLLALPTISTATIVQYTYEGSIIGLGGDYAPANYNVGDYVSFTVSANTSIDGYLQTSDGTQYVQTDTNVPGESTYDHFYASLVASSYSVPGTLYDDGSIGYFGVNINHMQLGEISEFYVGPERLRIATSEGFLDSYYVGMSAYSLHGWNSVDTGIYNQLNTTLTLTQITTVPLPAASLLFISGLIGLLTFRRKTNA